MENSFTEEDKKNVIEFLNFTSKNAQFSVNITEMLQYHNLLSYMQTKLIPKIEANYLEVIAVHEDKPLPKKPGKAKK